MIRRTVEERRGGWIEKWTLTLVERTAESWDGCGWAKPGANKGLNKGQQGPSRVRARVTRHQLRLGPPTLDSVGARPEDASSAGGAPEDPAGPGCDKCRRRRRSRGPWSWCVPVNVKVHYGVQACDW